MPVIPSKARNLKISQSLRSFDDDNFLLTFTIISSTNGGVTVTASSLKADISDDGCAIRAKAAV